MECPADIQETKLKLKEAQQCVWEIITKSAEKRCEHNKTIAEIHALLGGNTTEQALKAIIYAEDMSNMWKKISYANKNKYESNVSSISIPDSWPDADTTITADCKLKVPKKAETWCTIDLPEEILHYLTVRNRHHFGGKLACF